MVEPLCHCAPTHYSRTTVPRNQSFNLNSPAQSPGHSEVSQAMNYSKMDGNRNGIVRPVSALIICLAVRLSVCSSVCPSRCSFCWLCTCILYLTFAFFKQRIHPSPSASVTHSLTHSPTHSPTHSFVVIRSVCIYSCICLLSDACFRKIMCKQT